MSFRFKNKVKNYFFSFDKYDEFPKIFSKSSLIIFVTVFDNNLSKNYLNVK